MKKNPVYQKAKQFKNKYPKTIAWRLKAHCKVAEQYIDKDEEVLYVFACQKNTFSYEIFMTYVVVITNKRIVVAQKRLLFGHFFISITPDMYNDLSVRMGIIWGKICIDTVKEVVQLSNLQKSAVPEIEGAITEFMMEEKKKYGLID